MPTNRTRLSVEKKRVGTKSTSPGQGARASESLLAGSPEFASLSVESLLTSHCATVTPTRSRIRATRKDSELGASPVVSW